MSMISIKLILLIFRCTILILMPFFTLVACSTTGKGILSVETQALIGERFLQNGQYKKGYELLDTLAQQYPSSPIAALLLADIYYRQNAFVKSSFYYEKAGKLGSFVDGQLGLGRIALKRNRATEAKNIFIRILSSNPENSEALNGFGVALDLEGKHLKARDYYIKALKINPGDTLARNNLFLSLVLDNKLNKAAPIISDLLRSNMNNDTIQQNYALSLYLSGDIQRANQISALSLSQEQINDNFSVFRHYLK